MAAFVRSAAFAFLCMFAMAEGKRSGETGKVTARSQSQSFFQVAGYAKSRLDEALRTLCKDKPGCEVWASDRAECERNQPFMYPMCPESCNSCKTLDHLEGKAYLEMILYGLRSAKKAWQLISYKKISAADARRLVQVEYLISDAQNEKLAVDPNKLRSLIRNATEMIGELSEIYPYTQYNASRGIRLPALESKESGLLDATTDVSKTFTLLNGDEMPLMGFGTWQINGQPAYQAVKEALRCGYRHIDTAQAYGNEAEVGRAIQDSGVPRNNIFLATKLSVDTYGASNAHAQVRKQLQLLRTEYLDLYMLHGFHPNAQLLHTTWRALEEMVDQGIVRSIGVSNFGIADLEALLKVAKIKPSVVQNKFDIYHQGITFNLDGKDVVDFCSKNSMLLVAYSPLNPWPYKMSPLEDPTAIALAHKYDCTPSQILLKWALERSVAVIPRSTSPAHIRQNFEATQVPLGTNDMRLLDSLSWLVAAPWNRPTTPDLHGMGIQFVCSNKNDNCVEWAMSLECTRNPSFMRATCPMSCRSCEEVVMKLLNAGAGDSDPPGDQDEYHEL